MYYHYYVTLVVHLFLVNKIIYHNFHPIGLTSLEGHQPQSQVLRNSKLFDMKLPIDSL